MKVEREFAGFVLPFTAGVYLTAGCGLIRTAFIPYASSVALCATALLLLAMLHPLRHGLDAGWLWASIGLLGLCTGLFSGLGAAAMDISSAGWGFGEWTAGFGRRLGSFIDGIPFGDERAGSIVKALITGERNDIPPEVRDAFRDSGAAHILALSGFHLGIVYGIVRGALSLLGNSRGILMARSVSVIALCGAYTLATGAGPSIVRAFLFILLGETASMTHRHRSTASLLLSALLIQLTLSPSSAGSVSFQLSYAAMAGIAWIHPRLRSFWPGLASEDRPLISFIRQIWNSAALSISCQLTTAPLAWLYFESFPSHFLLTNLIALPLTSLIIPLSLAVIALSALGICPSVLLHATGRLVQALSSSLEIIAGM